MMLRWKKIEAPFLPLPPSHLQLTGWRDPFICCPSMSVSLLHTYSDARTTPVDLDATTPTTPTPTTATTATTAAAAPTTTTFHDSAPGVQEITMLIGSGIKGQGGTALVYTSTDLTQGWELDGLLCSGSSEDTGVVWECPLLIPLDSHRSTIERKKKKSSSISSSRVAVSTMTGPRWLFDKTSSGGLVAAHHHHQQAVLVDGGGVRSPLGTSTAINTAANNFSSSNILRSPSGLMSMKSGLSFSSLSSMPSVAARLKSMQSMQRLRAPGAGNNEGDDNDNDGFNSQATTPKTITTTTNSRRASHDDGEGILGGDVFGIDDYDDDDDRDADRGIVRRGAAPLAFQFSPTTSKSLEPPAGLGPTTSTSTYSRAPTPTSINQQQQWPLSPSSTSPSIVINKEQQQQWKASIKKGDNNGTSNTDGNTNEDPMNRMASLQSWMLEDSTHSGDGTYSKNEATTTTTTTTRPFDTTNNATTQPTTSSLVLPPFSNQQHDPRSSSDFTLTFQRTNLPSIKPKITDGTTTASVSKLHEDIVKLSLSSVGGQKDTTTTGGDEDDVLLKGELGEGEESATGAVLLSPTSSSLLPSPSPSPSPSIISTIEPPHRQWHFFTISPDAPTNPVLYWIGHVDDTGRRFDIDNAKGPFKLDLGDVLYAPNVCQDGDGKWLLWGWLQERRKVGSYSYAGCLSLPRYLSVTKDGRLVQAPLPQLGQLRRGKGFHVYKQSLHCDSVVPLEAVGGNRLDIEVTIEKGSAYAAGIIFRSHDAEEFGGTAIVYDWNTNLLEAIFNVPPNWQPSSIISSGGDLGGIFGVDATTPTAPIGLEDSTTSGVYVDPAVILSSPGGGAAAAAAAFVQSPSSKNSTEPTTPAAAAAAASSLSPSSSSKKKRSPTLAADRSLLSLQFQLQQEQQQQQPFQPNQEYQQSATTANEFKVDNTTTTNAAAAAVGGDDGAIDLDDLDQLLDELAGPMLDQTEAPQAPHELRRVGGPLSIPPVTIEGEGGREREGEEEEERSPSTLHLRILVDHSCIEVYTGSGEVLSTRVYRGIGGGGFTGTGNGSNSAGSGDPGIDFVSFGGTAMIHRLSAWEMGSAWNGVEEAEAEARAAAVAAANADAQQQGSISMGLGGGGASANPISIGGKSLSRTGSYQNFTTTTTTGPGSLSRSISVAHGFVGGPLDDAENTFDEMLMVLPPSSSAGTSIE